MAYITGTVAATANPAADLYAVIAPALTTAGFTLVDTQVISTRTHKVWKSAAANNAQGLDWWLDVAYVTTGAGSVWLLPMEVYDAATHVATRMACSGLNSTVIEQTNYAITASTGTLESATWGINASNATALGLTTSTGGFGYWISVTGDRVTAVSGTTPTALLYAGMFTPNSLHTTTAGASVFPLVVARFDVAAVSWAVATGTAATVQAALTRLPKVPTGGANWNGNCLCIPALPIASGLVAGNACWAPPPGNANTQMIGSRVVAPVWVTTGFSATTAYGPIGTLIGVAYGSSTTAVTRGDTVTISSESWVCSTGVSGVGCYLMKAA